MQGFKLKGIEENNLNGVQDRMEGILFLPLCSLCTCHAPGRLRLSQVQYLDLPLKQGYIIRSFENVLGNCLVLQIVAIITKRHNTKD